MKRPKIKIDENIPYIKGRLEEVADVEYLNQESFTKERIKDADALIIRTRTVCDRQLLEDTSVKQIVTATIGTDHIDTDYCRKTGIRVDNCPGCNAPGVAQYVWSSLLHCGFRPGKDKLGIIGYGNVGSIVAEWGLLLGTDILVNDPPKAKETGDFIKNRSEKIREASLEDIISECDAVTVHTPLTKDGDYPTFHLLGENLKLLKRGAIVVNAARGPVVDKEILTNLLKSREEGEREKERESAKEIKTIIDTWEGEPEISIDLLERTEIATPHIAGYSRQGKERATRMSIEAVNDFFNISGDTTGLTGVYLTPQGLTTEKIMASYNPYNDDRNLRKHPEEFEKLRHDYNYREETK